MTVFWWSVIGAISWLLLAIGLGIVIGGYFARREWDDQTAEGLADAEEERDE